MKILYFLGGVVVGSAATFLFLKERTARQIDEEVNSFKESYSFTRTHQKPSDETSEKDEEGIEETIKNDPEASKQAAERNAQIKADLMRTNALIKENSYSSVDTHKTSYNLFSHPPAAKDIHNGVDEGEDLEIDLDPDEEDPDILDTTPRKSVPGPYVLETDSLSSAAEKFINEEPYFDKVTLFLYDDGVLCSDQNEIITNIATTVGHESLERIGEFEPDVVYVRNEKTATDYEVIRQYQDFASIPRDDD